MSSPLPILRNTTGTFNAQVLYPFTRTVRFRTTVNSFMSGAEQRWPNTPPLYDFVLPMTALESADKAAWLSFFSNAAQVGRFGTIGSITIGSTTYSNLTLLSDDLSVSNPSSRIFNQQVELRQVNGYPWTPTSGYPWSPPASGLTYPTFSFGGVAEQPFTQVTRYLTSVGDNPNGPRYTYQWYQNSLPNMPTGSLRSWKISYGLLSQADMDTLEGFFTTVMGMAYSFSFTDPLTGSPLTGVRFENDSLEVHYVCPNQFSTSVSLIQTNGS